MMKYIYLLIGAALIAGGIGHVDISTIMYVVGVIFIAAGMGEILIGN